MIYQHPPSQLIKVIATQHGVDMAWLLNQAEQLKARTIESETVLRLPLAQGSLLMVSLLYWLKRLKESFPSLPYLQQCFWHEQTDHFPASLVVVYKPMNHDVLSHLIDTKYRCEHLISLMNPRTGV